MTRGSGYSGADDPPREPMRRHVAAWRALTTGAVLLAGCAPTKLLKATTEFSTMTESATINLGAAPGLVASICRLRAEIEFLTKRVEPGQQLTTFDAFFATTTYPIGLPGAPVITWRQQCLAYHVADDTFSKAVLSISDYGAALGGFASETIAPGSDMKSSVKAASDGLVQISSAAAPYKTALEGIGAPLSDLADAVATRWKAKELKKLVDETDKPLQDVLGKLEAFVKVLHDAQMRDLREALSTLLAEMAIRDLGGQKIDLMSGSMLDISITNQLAQFDRQIAALEDILQKLADAHAKLKAGWDAGEDVGLDTIKAVGTLARDVYTDVKAFEHPGNAGGA